ncbi:type II toxin-antitoxin system RelE/ParE family toxin [Methyloraptor flagellatus]|uniref:Type II toxin-antitoxin system RelE/ParE family toxin n=1 Tax=Methyloraptor flagellatus TaxID=3162530 RepID=A0AAU7X4N5_9HYPH
MVRRVRLRREAEDDLLAIHRYIARRASPIIARRYLDRIGGFLESLGHTPERGSIRDDVRPGLRIIGFERRVNVAFVVEADEVVVLRILYGGRQFGG